MDPTPLPYERAEPPGLRARRGEAPPPPPLLRWVGWSLIAVWTVLLIAGAAVVSEEGAVPAAACCGGPVLATLVLGVLSLARRSPWATAWMLAAHATLATLLLCLSAITAWGWHRWGGTPDARDAATLAGVATLGAGHAVALASSFGWHDHLNAAAFARRRRGRA